MKVESLDSESEEDPISHSPQEQANKNEVKQPGKAARDARLSYDPDNAKGEKEDAEGIKAQPKA